MGRAASEAGSLSNGTSAAIVWLTGFTIFPHSHDDSVQTCQGVAVQRGYLAYTQSCRRKPNSSPAGYQ
jgi:hypothetical protein